MTKLLNFSSKNTKILRKMDDKRLIPKSWVEVGDIK